MNRHCGNAMWELLKQEGSVRWRRNDSWLWVRGSQAFHKCLQELVLPTRIHAAHTNDELHEEDSGVVWIQIDNTNRRSKKQCVHLFLYWRRHARVLQKTTHNCVGRHPRIETEHTNWAPIHWTNECRERAGLHILCPASNYHLHLLSTNIENPCQRCPTWLGGLVHNPGIGTTSSGDADSGNYQEFGVVLATANL